MQRDKQKERKKDYERKDTFIREGRPETDWKDQRRERIKKETEPELV